MTTNEGDCWRQIADAFAGPKSEGTQLGLCRAVLNQCARIRDWTAFVSMQKRLNVHMMTIVFSCSGYAYPTTAKFRLARALAADWMALEADEEATCGGAA